MTFFSKSFFLVFSLLFLVGGFLGAQVPADVRTGTLPDGTAFFIQKNPKPEKRVEMRLVVHAGSAAEADNERGIAHLLEHMEFKGTEHFKANEIVNFLESEGMRFGNDLNAQTGFNSTEYFLELPTDKTESLEKGARILNDWAHGPRIDAGLLAKERDVVVEENRLRLENARGRVIDTIFPQLLAGSVYAHRLPIGVMDIVKSASPELVSGFARRWYTPANMAVVAVGDVDPAVLEKILRQAFTAPYPAGAQTAGSDAFVPNTQDRRVIFFKDKDLSQNQIQINWVSQVPFRDLKAMTRFETLDFLSSFIIGKRIDELRRQAAPPFLEAGLGSYHFAGGSAVFQVNVSVHDGQYLTGLEAILTEVRRATLRGFTAEDFNLAVKEYLSETEAAYRQRESRTHSDRAQDLSRAYLERTPLASDEEIYQLKKTLAGEITQAELNSWFTAQYSLKDFKLFCLSIDKEGNPVPSGSELTNLIDKVRKAEPSASAAKTVKLLFDQPPTPGTIVSEKTLPAIGFKVWTLSNGAQVYLKPNQLDKEQIQLSASAPGGLTLVSDRDVHTAQIAPELFDATGLGDLSAQELSDFMSGKQAQVSLDIGDTQVSIQGTAIKVDLETLFQLVNKRLGPPRRDLEAETGFINNWAEMVRNRENLPQTLFQNEISRLMTNTHPRSAPLTAYEASQISPDRAAQLYQQFLGTATPFTFVITGDFEEPVLRSLVCTYLASLPAQTGGTKVQDLGIRPAPGPKKSLIQKGQDQKAQIVQFISLERPYKPQERFAFRVLKDILEIRLREVVRDEKGGTYDVGVGAMLTPLPYGHSLVYTVFSCDPRRQNELSASLTEEVKAVRNGRIPPELFQRAVEMEVKEIETEQKTNSYWAEAVNAYLQFGNDLNDLPQLTSRFRQLTLEQVKTLAKEALDTDRMLTITLVPEKERALPKKE